jgi:uncharacterized protein involved in exopolysaccharide biosynthesis
MMDHPAEMQPDNTPSFGEIVLKYLSYWRWFLISLTLLLGLAFVYLRYTVPMYEASATVLIKDDKNGKPSLFPNLAENCNVQALAALVSRFIISSGT